jgi:pyrroloquinoline quinone (PQQ) biosynthesis protein C
MRNSLVPGPHASNLFFEQLDAAILAHPVLRHPFLERMASDRLDRTQLRAFAAQHYLYSRRFSRNLAAVISNSPDEHARTLLVLNMYEEIGEPSRLRDRVHLVILEEGLVTGAQLGAALEEQVTNGSQHGDVVSLLIEKGVISRAQVAAVMEQNTHKARDLTHPALFRRFLTALGLEGAELERIEPLPSTDDFNATYRGLCRDAHWLEGLAAMGPGTEGIVPNLYGRILEGIRNSEVVSAGDYVFWTIHVHCDEGHARNIVEAMAPYASDPSSQQLIMRGTMRALDARARWFDGLLGHVFAEMPRPRVTSGVERSVTKHSSVAPEAGEAVGT